MDNCAGHIIDMGAGLDTRFPCWFRGDDCNKIIRARVVQWCEAEFGCIKTRWYYIANPHLTGWYLEFYFRDTRDAVAFKMRWV